MIHPVTICLGTWLRRAKRATAPKAPDQFVFFSTQDIKRVRHQSDMFKEKPECTGNNRDIYLGPQEPRKR